MDSDNEEEHHRNPFLSSSNSSKIVTSFSRLQCRKHISKARWNEDMMMGEIIDMKGGIWASTGIVRDGGKLYCSIEEILFLAERGALILVDSMDTVLHLEEIYVKLDNGRSGCSWELFMAYRRLKSLGYIVGRHGVAWTVKHDSKNCSLSMQYKDLNDNGNSLVSVEGNSGESIIRQLNDVHITELKPDFDVFLPDSKFKKSSPGDPFCILCVIRQVPWLHKTRGYPPTRTEIEQLKMICKGVPIKFCHVDNWLVNFFSYDKLELPVLP